MIESADITNITSLGISVTLFLGVLLFILPRRYAPIPLLAIGAFMTYGQIVYVVGLHFTMLRVMILVGWVRVFSRGEVRNIHFSSLDKVFVCWVIAHVSIFILREQTSAAIVNKLGFAYNAAGLYLLFKVLVREFDDYEVIVKCLAVIMVPLAGAMVLEYVTGHNIFSIFGGVSEYTLIREDKVRCQGPFRHPILAGTFGATSLPLIVALYFKQNNRILILLAAVAALIVVFTSHSSGPLMALVGAFVGMSLWPLRSHMKAIRWGLAATVIGLHVVMKAPVWYLISRLSAITGGTGWHRSEVINQAVVHFDTWWLLGMNISETTNWLPYSLAISEEQIDITNQYVAEAVSGGIVTLSLFVGIIVLGYKYIGNKLKRTQNSDLYTRMASWCIGVCLFAHLLSFLSVTYFDQMQIYWYMLIAIISTMENGGQEKRIV